MTESTPGARSGVYTDRRNDEKEHGAYPTMTETDKLLMELHAVMLKVGSIPFVTGTEKEKLIRRIEERLAASTEEKSSEPPVIFSSGKWVYMGNADTPVSEHDSRELDAAAWHKLSPPSPQKTMCGCKWSDELRTWDCQALPGCRYDMNSMP